MTALLAPHIAGTKYQADRVAFTSDLHLGHDQPCIVEKRGFRSITAHDKAITTALMTLRCDHLFLLGDVIATGAAKTERALSFVQMLPYPVTLVLGNHDPSALALAALLPIETTSFIQLDDTLIELCHYPADFVDNKGRDFSALLPPDDGGILAHGHTHRQERFLITVKGTRQLHVGWDAWQRPVLGSELLAMTTTAGGHKIIA